MKKDKFATLIISILIALCMDIYWTVNNFLFCPFVSDYLLKIAIIPSIATIIYFSIRTILQYRSSKIKIDINYIFLLCSFLCFAALLTQLFFPIIPIIRIVICILLGVLFTAFIVLSFRNNFTINAKSFCHYFLQFLLCLFLMHFLFRIIAYLGLYLLQFFPAQN